MGNNTDMQVTRGLCSQAGTLPGRQADREAGMKAGIINIVLIFNKHEIFLQRLLGLP